MNDPKKKRVLICASDPRLIGNLQGILRSQEVEEATTGSKCLSLVDDFQPDILLLQMFLSDMDAFDLLTNIREHHSYRPKVVLFASANLGDAAGQFAALNIAGTILKSEPLESIHRQLQTYFDNQLSPLSQGCTAVYVTDSNLRAEQYARVFVNNSIEATRSETPETASGLIQQLQPRIILFEIEACLGQIFPIIRTTRAMKVPAGLIAVSRLDDKRLHYRMLESGVYSILNEPVSDDELSKAIDSILRFHIPSQQTTEAPQPSILVVEDAPESARTLELLLREHGYGVTIAETAEEAMRLLPESDFNLLLLDLLLPGMDGVELLARMRHSGCRIPCVVVTGSQNDKDRRLLNDLGVQAIFDKPADYDLVTSTIGDLIR